MQRQVLTAAVGTWPAYAKEVTAGILKEGFLKEEAFELAFKEGEESREERLLDRRGSGRSRPRPH